MEGEKSSKNNYIWHGNFNIYWLLGTTLGLWFLFVYTPLEGKADKLAPLEGPFVTHLVGAYFLYLVCMWNTFHTPSHGPNYRNIHVHFGRVAMVLGFLSFAFGAHAAWRKDRGVPQGLAIGLTIGGVLQVLCQIGGLYGMYKYKSAKEESEKISGLKTHIGYMLGIFLPSCGIPASMRLGTELGLDLNVSLAISIPLLVLMIPLMQKAIEKNRWY